MCRHQQEGGSIVQIVAMLTSELFLKRQLRRANRYDASSRIIGTIVEMPYLYRASDGRIIRVERSCSYAGGRGQRRLMR